MTYYTCMCMRACAHVCVLTFLSPLCPHWGVRLALHTLSPLSPQLVKGKTTGFCLELWTQIHSMASWPPNPVWWPGIESAHMDKHECGTWPVRGQGVLEDGGYPCSCYLLLTTGYRQPETETKLGLLHQDVSPGVTRSPAGHREKLPSTVLGHGPTTKPLDVVFPRE